jgi:hypothetical protein
MRHKIIYTDNYALIVGDEEIKDVRPFMGKYHLEDGLTINKFPDYLTDLGACKLIIAHRPLTDAPVLEGVPLLPEFGKKEDAEKLAYNWFVTADKKNTIFDLGWVNIFTAGYKKAKETYEYTEDDLENTIKCLLRAINEHNEVDKPTNFIWRDWYKKHIQSLQQPKRPKYFECEMEPKYKHIGAVKGIYGSGFRKQNLMYGLPKTITNSQGQKELIGTYEGGDRC